MGENPYYRKGTASFYARSIERKLGKVERDWDVVLSLDSAVTAALARFDAPLVYLSDANRCQLVELEYPGYNGFTARVIDRLYAIEEMVYDRSAAIVFSSDWAARCAIDRNGVAPEKVSVVPFGANIDSVPDFACAVEDGAWNDTRVCQLLFLGVDWVRKGGDIALEAVRILNRRGLKATLVVCGVVPPVPESDHLRVIPFLDKSKPEERARIEQLLLSASFLFLPTRADCTPVVFSEAFAHGLPVVTTDVGGVPEIVENRVRGYALAREADPEEYAEVIYQGFLDRDFYLGLRRNCREAYQKTYNWDVWSQTIFSRLSLLVK